MGMKRLSKAAQACYDQGRGAYKRAPLGDPTELCPYASARGGSYHRMHWFNGWYEARIEDKLGPILKKYRRLSEVDDCEYEGCTDFYT